MIAATGFGPVSSCRQYSLKGYAAAIRLQDCAAQFRRKNARASGSCIDQTLNLDRFGYWAEMLAVQCGSNGVGGRQSSLTTSWSRLARDLIECRTAAELPISAVARKQASRWYCALLDTGHLMA